MLKCREAQTETRMLVHYAAYSVNPSIAEELAYSIIKALSYDKLSALRYIPISRVDFYAYRRKTLAEFKRLLP